MTVKYRGGSEAWFEIHARGRVVRVPGHVALYDLMREISQQDLELPARKTKRQ